MTYLVDTNVLLRSIQQAHPMHSDAKRATAALSRQDQQLSIIAQNLIEFWAVATRPIANKRSLAGKLTTPASSRR